MKILVFGSTGFVGRNIVEILSEKHDVVPVVRRSTINKNRGVIDAFYSKKLSVRVVNTFSLEELTNTISSEEPDVVIYASGLLTGSWRDLRSVHVDLPSAILDAIGKTDPREKLFVYISSTGASRSIDKVLVEEKNHCSHVNELIGGYEKSKCLGEIEVREKASRLGINYIILRPTIMIGRYNTHREWVLLKRISSIGISIDLSFRLNVLDIEDLVGVIDRLILRRDLYNDYYHVASPKTISFKEISSVLREKLGKRSWIRISDKVIPFLKVIRSILPRGVYRSLIEAIIKGEYIVSVEKLLSRIDYVFRDPLESFERYFEWLINND